MKGAEGIAQQVGSSPKNGLAADAARRNRVCSFRVHGVHLISPSKERFGANEYPTRPPKSFFQCVYLPCLTNNPRLFLATLHDKTLIILMVAAVINIALGMTAESVKCALRKGIAA